MIPLSNPHIRSKKVEENKKNLIKAILVSNILIENLDELEGKGFYRHNLKRTVKRAVTELEKFSDSVWGKMTPEQVEQHTDTQLKFSKGIDEILELIINNQ